ncbi:MAG: transposase [Alphaproteobacteria bacterium CG_4_10_14_0_8_um_filter_37_21]|nr:MAG: transposase [Alphaproteobacteria bacterium CG_4_10_14_0_8_um_filter_37_21]
MPYKPKLKSSSTKSRSKPKYKVINWAEYNKKIQKRCELSFYFLKGDLKALFINENPYIPSLSGQQATYSYAYIELIFTFYRLFNFGMRQTSGYFENFWRN